MSTPPTTTLPDWETWHGQRRRLLAFLLLAGLYLAGHLIFRWLVEALFFVEDGCYGKEMPSWLEIGYHYYMTLLPIFAWGMLIFLALTLSPYLTHRRFALVLILLGLTFVEADMRWFQQSRKHASLSEIQAFLSVDPEVNCGSRTTGYSGFSSASTRRHWSFAC
jgi:hypothetical protein